MSLAGGTPSQEASRQRPSPEEALEQVRRQAGAGARGRLRIYLGMAPGVGKTFAMLNEGRRRKERSTDVVAGFVETYGRPRTAEAIGDLEVIPRKRIDYKGVVIEEMDTDAIIRRNPQVALVDELAHTNAPGSKHEKRWQDIHELLDHGITVIGTLNIQHVESVADVVESITGAPVRERIPDWVVDQADEVEVIDMSPHALRQRIRHGNVYPRERAEQALHSFFREGNLNALRELVLRKVATTVEEDLEQYMRQHQIETPWPAGDRVLAAVNDGPAAQRVIRRAWRLANKLQADLLAVFVEPPRWKNAAPAARRALEENLRYAEDLGASIYRAQGKVGDEVARIARETNAGSIVAGRPSGGRRLFGRSALDEIMRANRNVDLYVVADEDDDA
jgi:two-component system sensor histidine kinase KdpD